MNTITINHKTLETPYTRIIHDEGAGQNNRVRRKRGWFWSRNEIFDWWGKIIGPHGIAVYLCLCRHANENAECHPSFTRLAAECGMHRSTAIKAVQTLKSHGLIHVEPRINAHGDLDSNTYVILELDIPPPPGGGVVAHNDYPSRSQRLGVVAENDTKETNKKETNLRTTTTPTPPPLNLGEPLTAERGSGSNELIYPKELLPKEQEEAARMLKAVNGQAQQLLDELAGQLKAKEIKNPLGYLRVLIARAKEGKFSATVGIKVGESRKQRVEIEAGIRAGVEGAGRSQVWEDHRGELQDLVTPAEYSMNVMPLRGLEDGKALWLEAPNRFVADWVCGRMQLIEHVIKPHTSHEIRVRVG